MPHRSATTKRPHHSQRRRHHPPRHRPLRHQRQPRLRQRSAGFLQRLNHSSQSSRRPSNESRECSLPVLSKACRSARERVRTESASSLQESHTRGSTAVAGKPELARRLTTSAASACDRPEHSISQVSFISPTSSTARRRFQVESMGRTHQGSSPSSTFLPHGDHVLRDEVLAIREHGLTIVPIVRLLISQPVGKIASLQVC